MKRVLSFWCVGLGLLLAQPGLAAEPNYFAGQPIQPSWIKGQTPPGMYRGSPKHNGELETASRTQASLAGLAPGDYTTTFSVPAAGNYAAVSTTAGFTVYPDSEKPAYEYEWVEFPSANVHGAFDTGVRFNHRTTKLELKYQKTDDRYGMYLTASDDDDVLGCSTRLFVHGSDGFIVCQPNNNNLTIDESGTARADRDARVITLTGSDVTYKGVTMAYGSPLADADTTDTLWIGTGDRFGGVNRSPYYGIGHRFYHLKMWNVGSEGETLVHHWVPVKTTSGATMLYDKVTDRLLPPFAIPGSTLTLGGAATPMEGQPGAFDLPTQTSPAADAVLATQNAMHKEFYAKSMANRGIIASTTGWSANTGNYGEGAKYRLRMFNEGGCCPVQTRFSWTGNGPFTLEIRRAADRSLFYRQENIAGPSVLVDNLEVGMAYLWSVGNANGFSPWRAFSTETAVPRFLRGCSGISSVTIMGKIEKNQYEAVTNQTPHGVRDLGGYVGRDGRRVRQGLAIRTSEFDGEKGTDAAGVSFVTDENGRFWRDFLGIKTDIDLRNGAEWNQASSPLADAEHPVAWKNFASFPKNGGDLASSAARNNLRDAIRLFADRGNYPIAFHGVHGKGRTGCLSYMILGLLGVSQNDLHKDFEGTLFWHPYQTDADLTSLDEYIMGNALASPGTTLNERIESFVRNIGVSASDISAIREIMLDQAPSANEVWAVLGDGYSAFDGHPGVTNPHYPTGDVTTEDQTWWSQVVAHFGGEVGKVVAAAGSRISGEATDGGVAVASFYDRAKNGELGNPDHLLVMGGLNDWWGGIPDGEVFAKTCELFDLLDTRYAKARKIVVLPKRPGSDDVGLPSVYRSALKQAAQDHGYTVVDLDGAYTETATDIEGGHPNASGMAKIAGRVIASLEGTYAPPAHVHQYGEWVTTVPATETTAGERMRTCEADGCPYPFATEVERLPPTGDPDTYDYLLSDGVGYLPTDWRLTPTTRVELEFKLMADQEEKTGSCQSFFWLDDATGTEWGCTQWSKGGGIGYYYDVGDMEISGGLSNTVNRYVISAGGTNAFLAATSHAVSTVGAQALPHERIILFASRDRETHRIQYPARIKLYSFKVWDDAVSATDPVRNYVPVMDANGVATLYDEVTRTYLDAPVGGTFEVGNDTDDPVVVTKIAKPTLAAIWAGRDGANHCPSVAVTPAGAYTVEYSNGGNWTAVGDYTATCRLADTARYAWADGTTGDVVLPFAVIDRYDYLESDGHGYLLTDYPFDIANTHVEMKFQTMIDQEDKPYANQSFFWIDNATSGDEWGCTQWGKAGGIGYYYNSGEASASDALPDFDNTHTIRAWGNTVQFDGRAPVSGSASAPASLPHVNVMLFASRDWATQEVHYEARIRIDSFKIWEFDESKPVRNYVAVKRADGTSTFFDTVTGVYLDPSTGGFIVGNREQKADVGRFIQTDGRGYFDLGFKPHLRNTRIEIVSTLDPNQGGQGILWAGSGKVMGLCADPNDGTITYYATRVGGSGEGDGVSCPDSCHMGDTMVHTMTVGGRSFVIDGVETPCGYETADAEADGNAILFLNGSQGAPAVKLYSVRVWDVSRTPAVLVHSFVPGASADQLYDEVGGTSVTAQRVTDGTAYSFQLGQDAMIDLPTLTRTTFDYDNTEKRPLPESETFTQFGDVAKTAPGTYTVRVVPNGGYCWSDGSHAARTIEWTINGSWNPIATDFGISNRITVAEQDYCILTFTNTAAAGWSWTVPADVAEFEFLVAAGGGGGGAGNGWADDCRTGGGGGAGGVVTGRVANASGTFTVRVGAGGATGAELGASGANGGDSSLKLGGVNYVTAKGGGAGGGARYVSATDTGSDGAAGGSGGGGSAKDNQQTTTGGAMAAAEVGDGVTDWQSFGNLGGSGYGKSYAGGGGGACGAGESASAANAKNGEGGAGLVSPISGELATYGCGGGTGYCGAAGDGAAAAVATGNGGAGGYGDGDGVGFYGEAGGSGVVVIRYATSALPPPPPEVDTYDWLLADGNGYIETDYVPNLQKTRIEVVYEQTSHDSGFFWMANACTAPGGSGSGRQMYSLGFGLHGAAGEELRYGQAYEGDEHEVLYGTPERYVIVTNVTQGADVWRNGVHAAMPDYTANDAWASGPLVLFAGNWAGRYADGMKAMLKAKVYRVTISEVDGGTAEIRYNFMPAMDAYGRATMYDTISGQFADVQGDEAGYTVGNGYPTNPGPGPTPDPTATVAPVAVAPECGAMVDILTPMQRRFLAKSAEERRADFMSQAQRRNLCSLDYGFCNPQPITLRWEGAGTGSVGRCRVRVWRVKDGEETLHSIQEVLGDSTTVDNFEVAADYRWEVSNAIGTAGGTFTTRDEAPRLLRDPDLRQRITGIRDLGGRIGLDGRRVKQNLVFRSSRLNAPESEDESFITEANRSWWCDTLKIRTDLDLRSSTEVGEWNTTPIPYATWHHVPSLSYEDFVRSPQPFRICFNLFLDANNYPFVFHGEAGQDRTGCLAFVLEALLGVDADECLKDWEANVFRNGDVTWNHEACIDTFIAAFEGEAGNTLNERIVNWVKKHGYTDRDINTFRELMLESTSVDPVRRCDYLQTDGIGWLDLGFRPHLRNTRIEVVSTVDAGTAGANALAWAHGANGETGDCRIGCVFRPSGNGFSYCVSTGDAREREYGSSIVVPADKDGIHTVLFGGTDFVVDGVRTPVDELPDDQFAGENLQLFGARPDNDQASPSVKLYSVKVWEIEGTATNLVHHFVPVCVENGATLCDRLAETPTPLAVQGGGAHFTPGDDVAIDVPTCGTAFVYDGTAKRPLGDTVDYTVLGDVEATLPGTYRLRVVPNGGRRWADGGSHGVRVIEWTIAGSWEPVETAFGVSNTVTIASQDYCILSFTNTAAEGWSWTVPAGVESFDFLVVAGGGGGGAGNGMADYCRKGGGGGAGGVVTGRVANASGTFTVKVGAGGATGAELGASGENGGDSSLKLDGVNYVTAKGGGAGGGARYASATDTGSNGVAGGSGGGGSSRDNGKTRVGGSCESPEIGVGVTVYQTFGHAGWSGTGKSGAGIGGGAGDGGAGLVCAISGLPTEYARGGGIEHRGTADDGATAAVATGNGGAGGHGDGDGVGFYGEAGGSGVVIIRYAISHIGTVTIGDHPNLTAVWTCGDGSVTNEIEGTSFAVPEGTENVKVIFTADDGWEIVGDAVVDLGTVTSNILFGEGSDYRVPEVRDIRIWIPYLDYDEATGTMTNAAVWAERCTVVTADTQFLTNGWYAVTNEVVIPGGYRLVVKGEVHLILCDGAMLKIESPGEMQAAVKTTGASLAIYGQAAGSGTLVAVGGGTDTESRGSAGIGGDVYGAGGTVTINGGTVSATGGTGAAGIGGGYSGGGGTVRINGGAVTANGMRGDIAIRGGIFAQKPNDGWLASDCSVITNQDAATVAAYPWAVVPYPADWPAADDAVKAKFGAWRNGDGAEADLAAGASQKAFLLNVPVTGIKELKIESIAVDTNDCATIVVSAPGMFGFNIDLGDINGVLYVHAGDTLDTMEPKPVPYWTTTMGMANITVKAHFIRAAIGFKTP